MTDKHRKFCEAYVGDACGIAEQAALIAGYGKGYARSHAYKLLKRPDITKYINELNEGVNSYEENKAVKIASIKDIQSFWSETMLNPDNRVADRLKASEYLAKVKGMFSNEW